MREEFANYMDRITREAIKKMKLEDVANIQEHIDMIRDIVDEYPLSAFNGMLITLAATVNSSIEGRKRYILG